MEFSHSDSDVEPELLREEFLKERDEIIAGRRQHYNSYKDLSSDDDDWFLVEMLDYKRPGRKVEESDSESDSKSDIESDSENEEKETDSDEMQSWKLL